VIVTVTVTDSVWWSERCWSERETPLELLERETLLGWRDVEGYVEGYVDVRRRGSGTAEAWFQVYLIGNAMQFAAQKRRRRERGREPRSKSEAI